ncbi:hypothetical protein [Ascidiimonas sp. W6]|uniref:hypothetical protein n=1 Tax=Ascidiimonas meishanensis TaxID=3128903 RepID=UPI0030EBC405
MASETIKTIPFTDPATGRDGKLPVPTKFFNDLSNAKAALLNKNEKSNIKELTNDLNNVQQQGLTYLKNFLANPQKHTAEVNKANAKNNTVSKRPKVFSAASEAIKAGFTKTKKSETAPLKETKDPRNKKQAPAATNTKLPEGFATFVALNTIPKEFSDLASGPLNESQRPEKKRSPKKAPKKSAKKSAKTGPKM